MPSPDHQGYELPEWLAKEAGWALGPTDIPLAEDARNVIARALSECPVLGLTKREAGLAAGAVVAYAVVADELGENQDREDLEALRSKLLATRKALEERQ